MTQFDQYEKIESWNIDGGTDIPGKEASPPTEYYARLPAGIDIIPHTYGTIFGGREHADPEGEDSAIPLSDGLYSYNGRLWGPRTGNLIPMKPRTNQTKLPNAPCAKLERIPKQPDLETLRKLRECIDDLLNQHGN